MAPVTIDGKMVRKHACIDGPELDAHIIDWGKFLPRFSQFKAQEQEIRARHGLYVRELIRRRRRSETSATDGRQKK
jgi:hypothetical protein